MKKARIVLQNNTSCKRTCRRFEVFSPKQHQQDAINYCKSRHFAELLQILRLKNRHFFSGDNFICLLLRIIVTLLHIFYNIVA